MAADFIKIAKGSFPTGTMSVYLSTKPSGGEREITGKVVLKTGYPTYVKGVWMKLVCTNSVYSELVGILSQDMFVGDEDHYRDGFHQVLIGFGEGDNCHGTYLELAAGRHSWPFYFKIPYHAPASYFDGRISINYKLVATLDSPVLQNNNCRLVLNHEYVAPNYSNFSYLRIKEAQRMENRELLQTTNPLVAAKDASTHTGRFLPNFMSLLRTPVKLSIIGHAHEAEANVPAPLTTARMVGDDGRAIFPFVTKCHEYAIACTLENLRTKYPIQYKVELYSELCTRASPKLSFSPTYPNTIGQYNHPHDDPRHPHNQHGVDPRKAHTTCTTRLIWSNTYLFDPAAAEKVVLKIPIDVNTDPRSAAILNQPLPLPLKHDNHQGQIIHYSTEAPLFRFRTMLKVSVWRTDIQNQPLCAPVFGEIYILPPRPTPESAAMSRSASSASVTAPVPAPPAATAAGAGAGPGMARRPSAGRLLVASGSSVGTATGGVAVPGLVLDTVSADAEGAAEETMRPSPVPGAAAASAFVSPRPTTSVVTAGAVAEVAVPQAPTRPLSGHHNRHRSVRNHGGIASFRATQGANTSATTTAPATATATANAGAGSENTHPNVAPVSRTPHAKPTKSSHVIRVDAEPISRGPAAVLMDRNERRHEPIRTPQRFAFMYQICLANAVEGTPIVSAPTPVPISTGEYRAVRRSCGFPSDTPDHPSGTAAAAAGGAEVLEMGFQFPGAYDSVSGTPRPPHRQSLSYDSSFDHSGQHELADDPTGYAHTAAVTALPLPGDEDDHMIRMLGTAAEETPRQVRTFRETFNGVDWLAAHAAAPLGVDEAEAVAAVAGMDTARSEVVSMTAGAEMLSLEATGEPSLVSSGTEMQAILA